MRYTKIFLPFSPHVRCVRRAARGGKRKRKRWWSRELPPESVEGFRGAAMEGCSEPQLDAKAKVRPGLEEAGAVGSGARKIVP